jgi:ubiquinone/menaquinone biosynthesis C-methylase UbiE/uncharacterized protein YbaR (Trm112 family)
MQANEFVKALVCPDCKDVIVEVTINNSTVALACERCKLIFPIKDDILIILSKKGRNYALEHELICTVQRKAREHQIERIREYARNTMSYIELSKHSKEWEWEDESFWSAIYRMREETGEKLNWNSRIWQRAFLVNNLTQETNLGGKVILDLGCGEGQNFQSLLSRYCDADTLYVACDVSFEGLKRNRRLNVHTNSLYVLCSAEKLPFGSSSVDIICCFGVLHHLKDKANSIGEDLKLLKEGGYILIHEALEKMSVPLLSKAFVGRSKAFVCRDEVSAHEETINKRELLRQVSGPSTLRLVAKREMSTIVFAGAMTFMPSLVLNHEFVFRAITFVDQSLMRLLRRILPFFEPSEIQLLVQVLPAIGA